MAETPNSHSSRNKGLVIAAAVAVVALVIGAGVYFAGMNGETETQAASRADADVPMSELMDGGPLEDVVVGGIDATQDALLAMATGELDVSVFQDAAGQGAGALDAALKLARGEDVDQKVYVPFQLVTPENMTEFTSKN